VPVHDGAQHDVFRKPLRFRFDHQNGILRAGHDKFQVRFLQRGNTGVEYIFAIDIADFGRANGAGKRHPRDRKRGGGADQCGNIRIDVRIQRHNRRDDLDLVLEALREQRADRPVDEAANQRLFFTGTPFALEKPARDLAGCVGLFLVVDGQREEVSARVCRLAANRGYEYDGFRHVYENGTVCLARYGPGFQGDNVLAVLERFLD